MRTGNTKERIIEAALELFSVKGYAGTSMDEIAQAVGIKAPSIYDHYKSKEAILQKISDIADTEYDRGMEFGKAKTAGIHSGNELKEYALHSIRYTMNNDMVVKIRRLLSIEQFRDPFFSERATSHQITSIQTVYTEIFDRMMSDGLMIKGNPEIFALEFIAPVTLMLQLCDRQPERKEEAMKIIEDHIDVFIERYLN